MQTQMQAAKKGTITKAMRAVAKQEHLPAELIRDRVAEGLNLPSAPTLTTRISSPVT